MTVSPGKVEIGQGIVTALAQIAADELDVDLVARADGPPSTAASPNEGVTSGSLSIQQSGRACATPAPRSGRSFCSMRRTSGRRHRRARDRGRHHLGPRQCQDQLLGARRRRLARSRRDAGRYAQAVGAPCAGRAVGAAHRHSRQGVGPSPLHPRPGAARHAARPRAAAGEYRARNSSLWRRTARARWPGLSPSCATAILSASSAKPSTARRRRSRPCARARPGPTASPCPTKTIWLHS